jgi:hypothetical protein
MSKKKPTFACEEYPNCPNRMKAVSRPSESDGDEDVGRMTSIHFVPVTGRCRVKCYHEEMVEPVNHSVLGIVGGRVVDFGL